MTLEEMKNRKRELGFSNIELASRAGLPVGTVQKIFSGATLSPRRATIEALERVLYRKGTSPKQSFYSAEQEPYLWRGLPGLVKEADFVYGSEARKGKQQGEYTLEDYYALPDDRKAELIDGFIYDISSPLNIHQAISTFISGTLFDYVQKNKGPCMVYTAPFDVQLDRDNRTMVQPDITIICRRELLKKFGCFGAPDLVMEILSPSTSRKDLTLKLCKYMQAGVREYWVISPDDQQVIVYKNKEGSLSLHGYSFHDQVPVGIWNDECLVDFAAILEQIGFLYKLEE